MKARTGQLVRDRLDRDHAVALGFFAQIKFLRRVVVAYCEIGGLHISPRQIAVAVFGVAFVLLFAVRFMGAADAGQYDA